LADLADRSTLTGRLSAALGSLCTPQTVHDPGRVLADLAVAIGDGAECISDIAHLPGGVRPNQLADLDAGHACH